MIGGNSGINKRIDVMETEVYSPDFDQWTMVAQLSMGQSEAGACLVNDRIFIVGGYCWSARRCIKVIQVRFCIIDEVYRYDHVKYTIMAKINDLD